MKKEGFTLIELLIVISIIGILATVVLASLNKARSKAQDAKLLSRARAISEALEIYYIDNNSYPGDNEWTTFTNGDVQYFAANCPSSNSLGFESVWYANFEEFINDISPYIKDQSIIIDLTSLECMFYAKGDYYSSVYPYCLDATKNTYSLVFAMDTYYSSLVEFGGSSGRYDYAYCITPK